MQDLFDDFFELYFGMYKIVGIPQLFLDCKNKFAKILHKTFNEKEILGLNIWQAKFIY